MNSSFKQEKNHQPETQNAEHGTRNEEFFTKSFCSFKKKPIFALAKEK
jgi:hypothetical protein